MSTANNYRPTPLSGANARTEWTIERERELARPRDDVRDRIAPALSAALGTLGGKVTEASFYAWRSGFRLPRCLYDACSVEVSLDEVEGRSACTVRVVFRLESSDTRLNEILGLGMTLVGLPLAYAWRTLSIRQANGYAERSLDTLWKGLAEFDRHEVYR